jgi:hypothetical protein
VSAASDASLIVVMSREFAVCVPVNPGALHCETFQAAPRRQQFRVFGKMCSGSAGLWARSALTPVLPRFTKAQRFRAHAAHEVE